MFTDWIKEYTPFFSNIGTFLKILKYVPGLAGKISSSMSDFEEDNDLNINTQVGIFFPTGKFLCHILIQMDYSRQLVRKK